MADQYVDRIRRVAEFLDGLQPDEFGLSKPVIRHTVTGPNSVEVHQACPIGWLPKIFPKVFHWTMVGTGGYVAVTRKGEGLGPESNIVAAELYLGIKHDVAMRVLTTLGIGGVYADLPTAQRVAQELRRVASDRASWGQPFVEAPVETPEPPPPSVEDGELF